MTKTSICPTITADTQELYRQQIEHIAHFATRLHIDLSDGDFAPTKLVEIANVWWPGGMRADLHVMYRRPFEHAEALIALSPQLVIVHAEADGDFVTFADLLHHHGIEVGVALLPETTVESIAPAIEHIDHVLLFSGNLGHQGGSEADFSLLEKVAQVKTLQPRIEIGWDGGVNDHNAKALADGGIEVLNIGGYIHHADRPDIAYATLEAEL